MPHILKKGFSFSLVIIETTLLGINLYKTLIPGRPTRHSSELTLNDSCEIIKSELNITEKMKIFIL